MKKIMNVLLVFVLLSSMMLSSVPIEASETEIYDFDSVWFHPTNGFNTNHQGVLFLAIEYTDNTSRNIDYALLEYTEEPFYLSITFEDELEIIRDPEGNIIYQEPEDGYIYLSEIVMNIFLGDDPKQLGSRDWRYQTVNYQGLLWYRVYVPDFNSKYEWKTYIQPELNEKWFTWGNTESILFETNAMFIRLDSEESGHLMFDFTHPSDNSGQTVVISKTYLASKGITTPYFEWGNVNPWKQIGYTENDTHYFINPEHFSWIGVHNATSGITDAYNKGSTIDWTKDNLIGITWGETGQIYNGGTVSGITSDTLSRTIYLDFDEWLQSQSTTVRLSWKTRHYHYRGVGSQLCDHTRYNKVVDESPDWNSTYTFHANTGSYYFMSSLSQLSWADGSYEIQGKTYTYWGIPLNYLKAGIYYKGTNDILALYEDGTYIEYKSYYDLLEDTVNRTVGASSESNEFNWTGQPVNYSGNVIIGVPVSTDSSGILEVYNITGSETLTETDSFANINTTLFYYDSGNQIVFFCVLDADTRHHFYVNCTYGSTFSVSIPTFKEVGDDIFLQGIIKDADGKTIDGMMATTYIYFPNSSVAIDGVEWNCTNGNYQTTISTTSLVPGMYSISIEFTDQSSGVTFKEAETLYLSYAVPGGSGVYSDALVRFSFYNTNVGLGLIPETFKVYIDNVRNYDNKYYGYIGETINITIQDYYNFSMYSDNYTITQTNIGLNFGLTFHEYDFTNENDEYFYASFLKDGADRWYERVVSSSGGQKFFMLPTGNYTVRVYNADNSTYVSWTETINRSKAYLIGTDGVSLIIQGQSVIIGDILEFSQDLSAALLPDVVDVCYNTPSVWTKFRYEGLPIGWELVCPAQILTATTLNESTDNDFTSYPLVPTNGTSENGSIAINHDKIYFAGNSTWVNITYGGTSTNYSYLPSFISPFGADVHILAPYNVSIIRETEFQQMLLFDWLHRTDLNYYTATVSFSNTLNSAIREVYCYIEFPNEDMEEDDTEPKYSTVKVYDATNGRYIVTGQDFDSGATGIKFQLPSIAASETRSFTCSFYVKSSVETSSDAIVSVDSYDMRELDNKNYYHLFAQYVNTGSEFFVGSLIIKFNHTIKDFNRAPNSFVVYDNEHSRYLDYEEFAYLGVGSLLITQAALGQVDPNGARSFDVYFLFTDEEPTSVLPVGTPLHAEIVPNFPFIGSFQLFHLIAIACLFGIYFPVKHEYKTSSKKYRLVLAIFGMALFLCIIFYLNGY